MYYIIFYPAGGGYEGFDFSSQWRVIHSTSLPDSDPSLNRKVLHANSRASSLRLRCASTRRPSFCPKALKTGNNEQKKHGIKPESPRSPSKYMLYYDDNEFSAFDQQARLLTQHGFPLNNSLGDDPSFDNGEHVKSVS